MTETKKVDAAQGWFDRRDIVGLAGLALVGAGAWWVFPPAGLIIPGAILVSVAIFGVKG